MPTTPESCVCVCVRVMVQGGGPGAANATTLRASSLGLVPAAAAAAAAAAALVPPSQHAATAVYDDLSAAAAAAGGGAVCRPLHHCAQLCCHSAELISRRHVLTLLGQSGSLQPRTPAVSVPLPAFARPHTAPAAEHRPAIDLHRE